MKRLEAIKLSTNHSNTSHELLTSRQKGFNVKHCDSVCNNSEERVRGSQTQRQAAILCPPLAAAVIRCEKLSEIRNKGAKRGIQKHKGTVNHNLSYHANLLPRRNPFCVVREWSENYIYRKGLGLKTVLIRNRL